MLNKKLEIALKAAATEKERAFAFFGDKSDFAQSLQVQYDTDLHHIHRYATPGKDNANAVMTVISRITRQSSHTKRINDAAEYEEKSRWSQIVRIHPHLKSANIS